MAALESKATELTEEEATRYDRQVRVWGAEAQLRIQTAKVFIGGFRGLNIEAAKNLVLAGVSVVVQDSNVLSHEDLATNFFATAKDVGRNIAEASASKLQELNPFVKVEAVSAEITSLDAQYFQSFNVIMLSDCPEKIVTEIDREFRKGEQKALFWSGAFGVDAWFVGDFGDNFSFKDDPPKNKTTLQTSFNSFETVFQKPWRSVVSKHFPLSPIFVKSRILETYRNEFGRLPCSESADLPALIEITKRLFDANNYSVDHLQMGFEGGDPNGLVSLQELTYLSTIGACGGTLSSTCVLPCSVLGSFLSQEAIKAVSWSGEPAKTFFVMNGFGCEVKAIPM